MVTFGQGAPGLGAEGIEGLRGSGLVSAGHLQGRELAREAVPSGWPAIDALLPAGGVRRGSLIEWLAGDAADVTAGAAGGTGAVALACAVACRLAGASSVAPGRERCGTIVVVDRAGWFHPPAVLPWLGAAHAGRGEAGPCRLVVARPSRDDDEIWTIEQALRCSGVAAVVAWPRLESTWTAVDRVRGKRLPPRDGLRQWTTVLRRWQLAARSGGAVGLFVRAAAASHEPSWAEARFAVAPIPGGELSERRLRLVRVGGAWNGAEQAAARPVEIVIDLARGRAGAQSGHGAPLRRATATTAGLRGVLTGDVPCRAS